MNEFWGWGEREGERRRRVLWAWCGRRSKNPRSGDGGSTLPTPLALRHPPPLGLCHLLSRYLDKHISITMVIVRSMLLRSMRAHYSLGRRFVSNDGYDHAITELNKEMESIFGEAPSSGAFTLSASKEPQLGSPSVKSQPKLTHVDSSGQATMVDISSKEDTKRVAIANCRVLLGPKVFNLVSSNQIAKGDVLNVAKIAGINGAKQTSSLIPLCHNISLTHIRVDLTLNKEEFSVEIEGEATTTGKTGVEMEALTAVAVAGLTVYDMCKAASKDICITEVQLKHKSGGKSGEWSRKQ
ncbi:uncharacterized protein LOC109716553 [Ananas comosus]|uniref:cyclic pyranopterin monophosphate synthase n=1 Tax=Ananas comosus TaxID=4615 RepID=A0A6P5FPR5_ANACO|nr:uncharacterized protein LOC109716553 [Ananas comosus]